MISFGRPTTRQRRVTLAFPRLNTRSITLQKRDQSNFHSILTSTYTFEVKQYNQGWRIDNRIAFRLTQTRACSPFFHWLRGSRCAHFISIRPVLLPPLPISPCPLPAPAK